jgi:hypothetical protein
MRSFGHILISVAIFCATAFGLHVFLPAPRIDGISPKIEFIEEHRDEIDTLFIGSSRVYHGVNPRVFDAVTAAAGVPTHSYNFGVDAMLPPETFYVTDQILAAQPRKLRWVFIELEDIQVNVFQEHARTERACSWHDWNRTSLVLRKLLDLDVHGRWKEKRSNILRNRNALATHVGLLLERFANTGRIFDLTRWYPEEEDATQLEYEPAGDGYAPTMVAMDSERRARYEAWVARDPASASPREVDRYAGRTFRHYVEEFRSLGATPIFFVTPGSAAILPSKFIGAQPAAVMAFNDAKAFPSLYFADARIDEGHLNAAGADEFTRLLAERFVSWRRDPGG